LYHGDCRAIAPKLQGVDAFISDPPYGDAATHNAHLSSITLRNGEPARQALGFGGISVEECVALASSWTAAAARWVVFTCEWKYGHALDAAGLLIRLGIWRKPDGAPQFTGDRPGTGWEAVAICHRQGKKRWNGGGKHALWSHGFARDEVGSARVHPTQKPLRLMIDLVRDFTDPGEVILDPFAGSGTTGEAALIEGRRIILVERDAERCAIARARLAAAESGADWRAPASQPSLFAAVGS